MRALGRKVSAHPENVKDDGGSFSSSVEQHSATADRDGILLWEFLPLLGLKHKDRQSLQATDVWMAGQSAGDPLRDPALGALARAASTIRSRAHH